MPYVITGYLQVGVNVMLVSILFYFIIQFILTVRRDVDIKVSERLGGIPFLFSSFRCVE